MWAAVRFGMGVHLGRVFRLWLEKSPKKVKYWFSRSIGGVQSLTEKGAGTISLRSERNVYRPGFSTTCHESQPLQEDLEKQ